MTRITHIAAIALSATLSITAAAAQDSLGSIEPDFTEGPETLSFEQTEDTPQSLRFSLNDTGVGAANSWTGFYLGAAIGFGTLDSSDSSSIGADLNDAEGVFGGVFAGYQYDFGDYVLGVEVDFNAADFDGIDQLHRLKGRVGYDAGRFLPYLTAGAAYAEGNDNGSSFDDVGYLIGVGVDFEVTENIVIGGEFIYQDFNNFDGKGVNVDATTINARISYRF